jgi:hypothetical protein
MEIPEHIHKAQRISSSMAKCDENDYEALIEGAMVATCCDW